MSPESLLKKGRICGDHFRLVQTELKTASYESVQDFNNGQRRVEILDDLTREFDAALLAVQRNVTGARRYIVLFRTTSTTLARGRDVRALAPSVQHGSVSTSGRGTPARIRILLVVR